jgi:inner membrane protein
VRSGLGVAGSVGTLYGLLFVLLSLEDLALLVGSVAVFLGLAVVMYLTHGINWYGEVEAR